MSYFSNNDNHQFADNTDRPQNYFANAISRSTMIKGLYLEYDRDLMLGGNNIKNDDKMVLRITNCPRCATIDISGDMVNVNDRSAMVRKQCPLCKDNGWIYAPRRFSTKYEASWEEPLKYAPHCTNVNFV